MPRHRFHGDPSRFEVIADFIAERYWKNIRYIADVAGGQGMLARLLAKKYNYDCEVIDPRGWVLKGVKNRQVEYSSADAIYYDLIIGLHCDEALHPVAESALIRPVVLVPCCNFWSVEKLGQWELVNAIEQYYRDRGVAFERLTMPFKGPKNILIFSTPPTIPISSSVNS
jgi:hypothetical protein